MTRGSPYNGIMILDSLPHGQTGFHRTGEYFFRNLLQFLGPDSRAANLKSMMSSWSGRIPMYATVQNSIAQGTETDKRSGAFRFHSHARCGPRYFHRNPRNFLVPVPEQFYAGITKWSEVLADAYRCLKPGAYIELSEVGSKSFQFLPHGKYLITFLAKAQSDDGSLTEDSPLKRWMNLMKEAIAASGRNSPSEEILRERLEKAGYVDVKSFTLSQPFGPWAKDKYEPSITLSKPHILTVMSKQAPQKARHDDAVACRNGIPFLRYVSIGIQPPPVQRLSVSGLLAFTRILEMDPTEAEEICLKAAAHTKNKNLHAWVPQ
jgi:hypothetical protein